MATTASTVASPAPAPGVAEPPTPVAIVDGPVEPTGRWAIGGVLGWTALVAAALALGARLVADRPTIAVGAAPVVGDWDWHPSIGLLPAAALGLLVTVAGPRVADRMRWPALVGLAAIAGALWPAMLAGADGLDAIGAPLDTRYEYLPVAAELDDPGAFLDDFVATIDDQPTHVRGHPPGPVLALHALDRIGLGGAGWAAAFVLAWWGIGVAAVLVAARAVAGAAVARRAAPFLVVAPAAVWAGTSMDALFAGVTAVGLALVVVALTAPVVNRRAADGAAVAGGAVLALALHLTYGAVPLLGIAVLVAWHRRRLRPLLAAAVGAAVVTAAFVANGFWWFDGLSATREQYAQGLARLRPYGYFTALGNPGALALAVGPVVAAGLVSALVIVVRRRRTCSRLAERGAPPRRRGECLPGALALPVAAVAAVAVANLSGLSKGEVERIWLPFVPWLALAAALVAVNPRRATVLVGAQVTLALVLQAWLRSPW